MGRGNSKGIRKLDSYHQRILDKYGYIVIANTLRRKIGSVSKFELGVPLLIQAKTDIGDWETQHGELPIHDVTGRYPEYFYRMVTISHSVKGE